MKCPHCGFENKEGEEICSSCGNELKPSEAVDISDKDSETPPTYGAIYHLEMKEENEGESEEEENSIKEPSLSKDWRQELRQRVKEIKEKKEKEKKESSRDEAPFETEEKSDYTEPEERKIPPEPGAELKEEGPPPIKKKGKKGAAAKEAELQKEPSLFSLDEEKSPPSEPEESPPEEPPQPKEELPGEKTFPRELQKLVEDYEPLADEVYEEPLREEAVEKTKLAPEEELANRDIIIKSRLFAGIFDLMILTIVYLALIFFSIKIAGTNYLTLLKSAPLPFVGLLLLLTMAYFVFFTGFSGQTMGKMLLKIRVVSYEDKRVSFPRAFLRWLGYLISAGFLLLGFLWITFDSEARGWHDKIAGTRVEIYY